MIASMKEGYLNYYRNNLYTNAVGTKITGLSAGLGFLAGYLPIPFVGLHGERISQKWDAKLDTHSFAEAHATMESSSLGAIKAEQIEHD